MTRVAAYCRVSTDKADQHNSFESQRLFFSDYITRREDWTLYRIYADEGITGTSAAPRPGFLSMIGDAHAGLFDLIVTKEVSRFSRNILDAVRYTRALKADGVGVVFLSDGISTLDPDAELRLGIMASVAQEESRKTSQRVKWGQRRSMERGVVFGRSLLGYDVENGRINVEPAGAALVRTIFNLYVHEKMGARAIAAVLTADGVPTKSGRSDWSPATVLKILGNEKYCGDLIQRKTVTPDYLTHKKSANRDEASLIRITDHHVPIVGRALWEAAQAERARRSSASKSTPTPAGRGSRYPLSGKITCARCGAVFTCRTRRRKDGEPYRTWCGGCACPGVRVHLREELIADGVRALVAAVFKTGGPGCWTGLIDRLCRQTPDAAVRRNIGRAEQKLLRLADALISGDIEREAYLTLKKRYDGELTRLRGSVSAAEDAAGAVPEIDRLATLLRSGRGEDLNFYLGLVDRIDVLGTHALDVFLSGGDGAGRVFLEQQERFNIPRKMC